MVGSFFPREYLTIQRSYNKIKTCRKLDEIKSFPEHHDLIDHISFGELFEELNRIIEFKKIVIFIDEFDGIPQDELENFLTTLRDLYLEYKETFVKIVFDNIKYRPNDKEQSWLEQYGLVKRKKKQWLPITFIKRDFLRRFSTRLMFPKTFYQVKNKKVTSFTIGIGRSHEERTF
jgi:hypothetical protein